MAGSRKHKKKSNRSKRSKRSSVIPEQIGGFTEVIPFTGITPSSKFSRPGGFPGSGKFPLRYSQLYNGEGPQQGPAFDNAITKSIFSITKLIEDAVIQRKNNIEFLISRPPKAFVNQFGVFKDYRVFHPNDISTDANRSGYLQAMYNADNDATKEWNDAMDKKFEKVLLSHIGPKILDDSFNITVEDVENTVNKTKIDYEELRHIANNWVKAEPFIKVLRISWQPYFSESNLK